MLRQLQDTPSLAHPSVAPSVAPPSLASQVSQDYDEMMKQLLGGVRVRVGMPLA